MPLACSVHGFVEPPRARSNPVRDGDWRVEKVTLQNSIRHPLDLSIMSGNSFFMISTTSTIRRYKNSASLDIPMSILLDEQYPFRLSDGSEMPETIEVELAIGDGNFIVTQVSPRAPILDDIQSLYDS